MPGSILGSSVRRVEDPRLVTGRGLYSDDLPPAGGLHAVFVRSHLAHARVLGVDTEAAAALPGVVGVFTAGDLGLPARLAFGILDDDLARPPLAADVVRFVGDPVAVVVAETRAAAADAAQAVFVEYEPLPVAATAEAAAAEGAPLLFPAHGSNLAFEVHGSAQGDVLEDAEVVVRATFRNQRLAAVPLEPNVVVAQPDPDTGGLRLWASTQSPFQVRDFVADCLGLPEPSVRVTLPDVGGGFGAKLQVYPEQAVVAALARRLQRQVRWVETRTENLLTMSQGRAQVQEVALGATRDGCLSGLRVRVLQDAGAYPGLGAYLPFMTGQMCGGVYAIPRIDFASAAYVTNTTPIGAYRGAGRPEATALIERAVDMLAAELGIDPVDLRRRNLIPPEAFPHPTPTGVTYDSGDYAAALDRVLALAGYEQLRAEQRRRREAGERTLLGIGLSTYVEITAVGSPTEFGATEVGPDGAVTVLVGTASSGQGHATAFAQIAAAELGLPVERVRVVEGDTSLVARGDGTSGSRSVQLGGSAVQESAEALLARARRLAAHLLEADEADLDLLPEGGLGVRGAPGRGLSWAQLGAAALDPTRQPEGQEAGPLREEADVVGDASFPFGAHLAVVEVDLDTGDARLLRIFAVDDCGTVVNPTLVEGQIHGGIAQGVAQALYEQVEHDALGIPLSASLIDYAAPSIGESPVVVAEGMVTPSPNNRLGAKGIGESGTIGSTPAVQNAVIDAIAHLGIRHLDMPLSPGRIWTALEEARDRA